MTNAWLILTVHWVHVVSGVIFGGGILVAALGIWPALLRLPAPQARAAFQAMEAAMPKVMAPSGILAIVLGILRGTWLGPIDSWAALFGSAYGWTFLLAIAAVLFVMIHGGMARSRLERHVWDGDQWRPGATAAVWRMNLPSVAAMVVLLTCMVAMRFGW